MDLPESEVVLDSPSSQEKLIKLMPVINATFLDKEFIVSKLLIAYAMEGADQDYIEWDTSWDYSESSTELSEYFISKGVPKGTIFLLQLFDASQY